MKMLDKKSIALIAIIALMAGLGFAANQMAINLAKENVALKSSDKELQAQIQSQKEKYVAIATDPDGHWILPTPDEYALTQAPENSSVGFLPREIEGTSIYYKRATLPELEGGPDVDVFIFPKPPNRSVEDLFLPMASRYKNECETCGIPKFENIEGLRTLTFYSAGGIVADRLAYFVSEKDGYVLFIDLNEGHENIAKELIKKFYVIPR